MAYIDNVNKVLNIQPEAAPTRVRLSQNENGRNLYFTLAGNENPIPSGVTVTISGTKPDGTVYSGTGSISNDVVLIPETVQLTAVAGVWDAKVKITSGGNTVATGRIRFLIDADTVAPGSVPSSSVLEGLVEQAQQYAETARQEAYGSPLTAALASDMTDKTRVYVYTGSEVSYTAGHWYYWNGSAWSDGGVYNSTAVQTDKTLSLMDVAADGKAVGDAIAEITIPTDKTLTMSDAPADALVVGEKLALIKEMIAGVEVTSTATKAYAIGDLVIVGDVLYKMTKAITSGTQIGSTNAQKTTIADMLEYEITDLKSKLYERIGDLDSEQTAIKGMITGIESAYTATKDYNVDDLLIVESSLFKATAAIATGSQINASNVVATTIASAISDLKGDLSDISEVETVTVDKSTGTKLSAYVSGSGNIGSNNDCKLIYVGCLPSTTYTINKALSARFRVGYTAVTPAIGGTVSGLIGNNDGTSIDITTGESAQYLVIYYYDGVNDSLTERAIYDSLAITYITEITAVDKVARDNAVRFDVVQNKTEAEKARARENIGVSSGGEGLSDDAKEALLTCFEHIALWDDDQGDSYISALHNALYSIGYPKIIASFAPGSHTVYSTDSLDSLKPYLTVTYYENELSEGAVVTTYTLSGTLSDAISYITVVYNNFSTKFSVNVVDVDNIMEWNYPSDITGVVGGSPERVSSSDTRVVINTSASTYSMVIGNTLKSPKVMNRNLVPLSIAPIQLPEGTTGATVTFSTSGTGTSQYSFVRLRKTDDYYTVITWTTPISSGERTAFSSSDQLVMLIISAASGTISSVNNAKIVFDKNT